jgi:hypothetical protein
MATRQSRKALALLAVLFLLAIPLPERRVPASPGLGAPVAAPLLPGADPARRGVTTFIDCAGVGKVAVSISEPAEPRYAEGAPVVVAVSGFFTPSVGYVFELNPDVLGAVYITMLWPGVRDARTGVASEGTFDFGGEACLRALRDVLRFATGEAQDAGGRSLQDVVSVPVLYDVAGLYAFSHSGILATNVLCLYGDVLQRVRFFVGRENPTIDPQYPLEPGHWSDDGRPVDNPFYDPYGTTSMTVAIDYSTVDWSWEEGRPVFRAEDGLDYVCSSKHPSMWGKDYWSTALLQALLDHGALTRASWPASLATPEEAAAAWAFRATVENYPRLSLVLPDLKVMLVFAANDHVQTAIDKPHIRQAYDGFHDRAGLWCRLNPDRAYVEALLGRTASFTPDNPANARPETWMNVRSWAYPTPRDANLNVIEPLAAVAEMCDRTWQSEWRDDLDAPLVPISPIGQPLGS